MTPKRRKDTGKGRADELIARMKKARGYIYPEWEFAARQDPEFVEIYTLSLHDALPISSPAPATAPSPPSWRRCGAGWASSWTSWTDRKSTRLNSSHT